MTPTSGTGDFFGRCLKCQAVRSLHRAHLTKRAGNGYSDNTCLPDGVRTMKITTALAVLLGGLSLSTGAAADQFYKWTDAQGVTHYSADPPPKSATSTSEVKVSTKVPSGSGTVRNMWVRGASGRGVWMITRDEWRVG